MAELEVQKGLPLAEAKEQVVSLVARGFDVKRAMAAVARTPRTFESWREKDREFARKIDEVRAARQGGKEAAPEKVVSRKDISFEDFRREYLQSETYPHQRAWIQAIETGDVDETLPGSFKKGRRDRLLINTPPFHAKSMTLTIEYCTYRICMNSNVRIIIVSKTQAQAKKFLHAIKQRLTDNRWAKLQAAFAPEGGFKSADGVWSSTQIYVAGEASGEKDPTVEALGIGGQIYGARADLIILDDVADVKNAHQFESQIDWLQQDAMSRLYGGLLLAVGTRVGVQDIYSELMNGERYLSGTSPWSHLKQPAVLHYADQPEDWVTLWPRASRPLDEESETTPDEEGLYPAWDGPKLDGVRGGVAPARWSLVYMQDAVSSDTTFSPVCVWGSVDRRRKPGPMRGGAWGGPRNGNEGMYTIASMDPAMVGDTFTVVGSVDRTTHKRWLENAFVSPGSTQYIRDTIKTVTDEYQVNEWVIEANAFQLFLTQDPEITNFLNTRGVKLTPHYTGGFNKQDPDFGVAALATLFGTTRKIHDGNGREVHNGDHLLQLPDPDYSNGVKTLIEELFTWVPGKRGKDLRQDGPMALWFFNLRAMQILGFGRSGEITQFRKSRFSTRGHSKKRMIQPQYTFGGDG